MKSQNDVRVTVRVDKDLKERAEIIFDRMGMNMSTALNVFLRKAVDEEAIPFQISVGKAVFAGGMTSDDISEAFVAAVRSDIAAARQNGLPVARYDKASKQAYLEFPDGAREYINA